MSLRDAKPVQDAMNNILNQQAETIAMRPARPLKWWERIWVWWRRRREPRRDPVPAFVSHAQREADLMTGEHPAMLGTGIPGMQLRVIADRIAHNDFDHVQAEEISREEFERHTVWIKYAALGITLTPEQAIAIERLVNVRITDERERCARIAGRMRGALVTEIAAEIRKDPGA